MSPKTPSRDTSRENDETLESEPKSDEARIPMKGALMPEHPRDGRAEATDMDLLAQRAVESGEDPEAPLDFTHPSRDARDDAAEDVDADDANDDADDDDDDEPA